MNNLTIAALIAAGAALWQQIRAIFSTLAGFLVTTAVIRGECATAMRLYLSHRASWSKWGRQRCYVACGIVSPKTERWEQLPGEYVGECPSVYWVGWRPLFVGSGESGNGHNPGGQIAITCLRFMFDLDRLILDAMEEWKRHRDRPSGRFQIVNIRNDRRQQNYPSVGATSSQIQPPKENPFSGNTFDLRPIGWSLEEMLPKKSSAGSIDELALSPDASALVARVERWRQSEHWFKAHHVPWKTGFLLHGKPGTGKTALIRAIGRLLDIPVFVFDLATLDNVEFSQEWERAVCQSPCMMVFEDLDAVFEGRKNIAHSGTLTTSPLDFSCLLNALDGLHVNNGVVIAGTTNRVEVLDDALLRPGRFDVAVEMPQLTTDGKHRIAARILREWPDEQEAVVHGCNGVSGAEFQKRCTMRAQELFWEAR